MNDIQVRGEGIAMRAEKVSYGTAGVSIVENLRLDVRYGQVLALVGPNGAGKSTLLGLLSGDLPASSGSITLDGSPLREFSAKELARRRAVLLQANQVNFSFTVGQVVEMGRAPWAGTSDDDERLMAEALEVTDTRRFVDRSFSTLSGGEKARVSLARVLTQDTRIVMLDEPTAALDLHHQEEVLHIARELADRGRAVVVVLHDLSLASAYADVLVVMHDGRIRASGTPREVLTSELVHEVYGVSAEVHDLGGRLVVVPEPRRPFTHQITTTS